MPIEIRELHIKVNVNTDTKARNENASEKESKEAIIAECVEQVLDIIKESKER